MRKLTFLLLAAAMLATSAPLPVIFDTDMGNDIDDALALAILHAFDSRGECRLIGVTLTNPALSAGPFVRMVNRFYGRPGIPVGISRAERKQGADHKYMDQTLAAAPAALRESKPPAFEDAVTVLRRLLQHSTEKVAIVQVGFSETLAGLLASDGGPALAREKVALLSAMAGDFSRPNPEYNVKIDIPAAQRVFGSWPTPVVVSGYEIGRELLYPAANIERDFAYVPWHPIAAAYRAYKTMPYDRQTWDLTAALAAVRPQAGYFDLSPPGVVEVDDKGITRFHPTPEGRHRYLILPPDRKARIIEAMTLLASQPPQTR